ncbi:MAG: ABC transporter permease, partial [Candidatus Krumholzibacteriia bacterium]
MGVEGRPSRWLSLGRNVTLGLEAFRTHRLRTALTTLGVVFGVGAVICMLAIGKGAEQKVLVELRRLGVRNLHVEARRAEEKGSSLGLVLDDARAVTTTLAPHVQGGAPERFQSATVWVGPRSAEVVLSGVTPEYARYLDLEVVQGRFVSSLDDARGAAVCVLSEALLPVLLPARRPLGAVVRFGRQAFRIVGVVRGVALGNEERPPVFMPLSTAWRSLPRKRDARELQRIVLRLGEDADPSSVGRLVGASLLRRHAGTRDFTVIVPLELIR